MDMTSRHWPLLTTMVLALALFSCGGEEKKSEAPAKDGPGTPAAEGSGEKAPAPQAEVSSDSIGVLHTTQGKIKIEFFPDKAPEHVKNFITLAKQGFFDGTYFHRCFPGFMVQGGDPNTKDADPRNDGLGGHSYKGPGKFLKAEFNKVNHVRGIVSMARSLDVDSAGSQFFIMVAANPGLNGQYSAFGKVVAGMDVVDKIVKQPGKPIPGAGGVNPFKHQYIDKITFE